MNILFNFEYPIIPSNGGVQRVTDILAREFIKLGHKVFFVTRDKSTIPDDYGFSAPQYQCLDGDYTEFVADLVEKEGIDVLLNQEFSQEIIPSLNRVREKGVLVLSTFHSLPFASYENEKRIYGSLTPKNAVGKAFRVIAIWTPWLIRKYLTRPSQRLFKCLANSSDKVVLLSENYICRVEELIGSKCIDKFTAINNPNTFSTPEVLNKARTSTVLLVGRIEDLSKNVSGFIRMWKILNSINPNIKAVVVGDGSDLLRMKTLVKDLKVNNIEFKGHCSDVASYYQQAKLLCVTSHFEGWPMVISEAMSYGCVPIAFNTFPAVYDMISDNENGFIIEKYDYTAMANKINEVLSPDYDLNRLSEAAARKSKKYESSLIAEQWIKLIEQIKSEKNDETTNNNKA